MHKPQKLRMSFNFFKKNIFLFLTTLLSFTCIGGLHAQVPPQDTVHLIDTARLTKFNADSVKKYFRASDTLISHQLNKIEGYSNYFNKMSKKLRRGFDTTFITNHLPETDTILSIASTNLQGFRGHASLKILSSTKNLLNAQKTILNKWQDELSTYNADLNAIKDKIRQISMDSSLLIMPADSVLFSEYIKKLKPLGNKIESIDSITGFQLA